MSEEKKASWSYGVRTDGSIWTHFDGPGPIHSGCDWPGNERQARLAVAAPELLAALEAIEQAEADEAELTLHHNRVFWKDAYERTKDDVAETMRLRQKAYDSAERAKELRKSALALATGKEAP